MGFAHASNDLVVQLKKTIKLVQDEYVLKKTDQDIFKLTIDGLLRNIDPYSEYLTEDELESVKLHTSGRFYGIGIQLENKGGKITVASVMDNCPAFVADLKPGDIIKSVNSKKTINYCQISEEIKNSGDKVRLTIERNNKIINLNVEKSVIRISPIVSIIEDDILYIRILQFNRLTSHDLKRELIYLTNESISGIILDLRNNGGGLFDEAIAVANIFLRSGEIVSTVNFNNKESKKYYAQAKNALDYYTPMVVLVNRFSASSSEIVAGALKFNKRAILIGEKTFGKGSVQTIMPLDKNMGAIKITTSYYKSPNGKIIEKNGIEPDIQINKDDNGTYISTAVEKLHA